MYPKLGIGAEFALPGIVSAEFETGSREVTADYLTRQQVPFEEIPEGSLVVPAREANGAMLFFT